MTMKNSSIKVLIFTIFIILGLSACSQWQGNLAKIVISFGEAGRAAGYNTSPQTLQKLEHQIELSNKRETLKFKSKGTATFESFVEPGEYTIWVYSWLNNDVFAAGTIEVNLQVGQDNILTIPMSQAHLVRFNSNGGSSVQDQVVFNNKKAVAPSPPTRTGYSFGGWYMEGESTSFNFNSLLSKSITLYAKWEALTVPGNIPVTGVTVTPATATVPRGGTQQFTATVTPNNAPQTVTWAITGNGTGTSINTNGLLTVGATSQAGTLTVTATSTADTTKKATATVTVTIMPDIEMVQIPGGSFTMGSDDSQDFGASPPHTVTLSGFYMGKYLVTQEQYQAVMGSNPSNFKSAVTGESGTPGKLPVEKVSWYDALVFCNKLSIMEGLSPAYRISGSTDPAAWGTVPPVGSGNNATWDAVEIVTGSTGYRLPTEAQWEYACRAGTTTVYNTGDTFSDSIGWYGDNSGSKTHQVGLKPANAWGLYDMNGNVYEWCWDRYGSYSSSGAQTDPTGAVTGTNRVIRGGFWNTLVEYLRSADRHYDIPSSRDESSGFRLARP